MYTISGCYGISYEKQYKDTEVFPSWDANVFVNYSTSPGFMADQQTLCNYVEDNRNALNIDPDWDMVRDCLYYQVGQTSSARRASRALPVLYTYTSRVNHSDIKSAADPPEAVTRLELLAWGVASTVNGALIGIEVETDDSPSSFKKYSSSYRVHENTDFRRDLYEEVMNGDVVITDVGADDFSTVMPIWICNNFSVLSPVPSLIADTAAAQQLLSKWKSVFEDYGSANAKAAGVPCELSSNAFTLPLLAAEVLTSIEIAGIVSLAGFVVLLFAFTWDISLMLFGTLIMTVILCTTFCLHLYFVTNIVDLLDIVVLIAIIGMIVDFPIHMLKYFTMERKHKQLHGRESFSTGSKRPSQVLPLSNSVDGAIVKNADEYSRVPVDHHDAEGLFIEDSGVGSSHVVNEGIEGLIPDSSFREGGSNSLVTGIDESNIFQEVRQSFTLQNETIVIQAGPAHTMAYSLFAPCATSVLVALPLLLATLELLKKTGEYIVIMAVVSYFITCFVAPSILELSCRTTMKDMSKFFLARSPTLLSFQANPAPPRMASITLAESLGANAINNECEDRASCMLAAPLLDRDPEVVNSGMLLGVDSPPSAAEISIIHDEDPDAVKCY
jgi:hypothetical protein